MSETASSVMDLRELLARLQQRGDQNAVICYEGGVTVSRSHQTVHSDVMRTVERLKRWGVRAGMRVGILARNCYEWIVYDLALLELRAFVIAFTDGVASLRAESLIEKYSLSLLLVDHNLGSPAWLQTPSVVLLDSPPDNACVRPSMQLEQDPGFLHLGLAFSSGSSGRLKGLALNRLGVEASIQAFTDRVQPSSQDCLLLFLPISNFQQRLMYYAAFWYGFNLIVTDPTRLFPALRDLEPSLLIAPPLLYEGVASRFYNLPAGKQWLVLFLAKAIRLMPGKGLRLLAGRKVFQSVHAVFGKKMRFMVTGMAPIKRSTLELFSLMQLPLFETYGLTEFGSITLNVPGANKIGSVGRPLPGVKVDFLPDGEVVAVREHTIASSYAEGVEDGGTSTFLGDNGIATGDVGYMDRDGYLFLVGRKNEMIVTPGGDKIHPEVLEARLNACSQVERSVVLGSSEQPSLTAVILPRNPESGEQKKIIQEFVTGLGSDSGQLSVGEVIFIDTPFTLDSGLLLANLKVNRRAVAERFAPHTLAQAEASMQEVARGVR